MVYKSKLTMKRMAAVYPAAQVFLRTLNKEKARKTIEKMIKTGAADPEVPNFVGAGNHNCKTSADITIECSASKDPEKRSLAKNFSFIRAQFLLWPADDSTFEGKQTCINECFAVRFLLLCLDPPVDTCMYSSHPTFHKTNLLSLVTADRIRCQRKRQPQWSRN